MTETETTMFGSVCTKYGPAGEVFELRRDLPRPALSLLTAATAEDAPRILVRNEMTSVNPADCKQRSGNLRLIAKHDFPLVLGQDFCGRVADVEVAGSKAAAAAAKFRVGDAVMGSTAPRNSCSAEYLWVYESECAKIDLREKDGVSAAAAAATPTAYCTAWKGLFDPGYGNLPVRADLGELCADNKTCGEKKKKNKTNTDDATAAAAAADRLLSVLVIGASGSVGSAAVQLAVGVAANVKKVVGICGTKNVEYVRSLGNNGREVVVEAIDYRQQPDFAGGLRNECFDLILDCVGGDDYYYALHPLLNFDNPRAFYVTCVGPVLHGGSEPITARTLLSTAGTLVPRLIGNFLFPRRSRRNSRYKIYLGFETALPALETVARLLENGVVRPRIDPASPVPLRDLGRAHELVETGHSSGKVVVEIQIE